MTLKNIHSSLVLLGFVTWSPAHAEVSCQELRRKQAATEGIPFRDYVQDYPCPASRPVPNNDHPNAPSTDAVIREECHCTDSSTAACTLSLLDFGVGQHHHVAMDVFVGQIAHAFDMARRDGQMIVDLGIQGTADAHDDGSGVGDWATVYSQTPSCAEKRTGSYLDPDLAKLRACVVRTRLESRVGLGLTFSDVPLYAYDYPTTTGNINKAAYHRRVDVTYTLLGVCNG